MGELAQGGPHVRDTLLLNDVPSSPCAIDPVSPECRTHAHGREVNARDEGHGWSDRQAKLREALTATSAPAPISASGPLATPNAVGIFREPQGQRPAGQREEEMSPLELANNLAGNGLPGVVFIGVTDDGSSARLGITDQLLTNLAGLRDDGTIMPIPSLVVQRHILSGREVATIVVEPSRSPPVRYRGRVWVRVGPTVRQATPEEVQRLRQHAGIGVPIP